MIRCEHIYKSFDGKPVLEDISATFLPGEINMIIGRSGSGKTVLIKSIAGLFPVDEGEIYYGDTLFTSLDFRQKKAIRRDVGMIFQGGALLDSSTVEENIRFPLDMFTGQSMAEKRERVAFCLHRVNLEGAEKLYPAELSGGMIKRVAIARAIAFKPEVLLFDEPTSALDPETIQEVLDVMIKLAKENITMVVVTHEMGFARQVADRIVFMADGMILEEGTPDEFFENPTNERLKQFLGKIIRK